MRSKLITTLAAFVLVATSSVWGQSQGQGTTQQDNVPQGRAPVFHSKVNLILVDVDVRDKNGLPLKGLKQSDFQLFEDGKAQEILNFKYEEVAPTTKAVETVSTLAAKNTDKGAVAITTKPVKPAAKPADKPADAPAEEVKAPIDAGQGLTSDQVANHRLWILLFDTSSMQPEDVQRAVDSATKWATESMTMSDLVGVLTIGSTITSLQDFTNDKAKTLDTLKKLSAADGTAAAATDVDASTMTSDEALATQTSSDTTVDQSAQEIDSFNNDVRLRALKTVCDQVKDIQQKKAMLYFSSGMQRNGSDNAVEMRSAEQSCVRANVSMYTQDSRGLQAVPPGGTGRTGSRGGVGSFNGAGVRGQFSQLAAQQETLQALASDTGGQAFVDSNDFGEAFTRVEKDISSYYILGYSSTNSNQDGAYRRIEVKLASKLDGKLARVRPGYYADRDFTHTAKGDREQQLMDQLDLPIPSTDVPMFVTAGYFRSATATQCAGNGFRGGRGGPGGPGGQGARGAGQGGANGAGGTAGAGASAAPTEPPGCYYVPVSIAVPGDAVLAQKDKATTLDVRGYIRDERGMPIATIKDTLTIPPASTDSLPQKQVLYQTGTAMPPGRYRLKVAIRENATGQIGVFETGMVVPDLRSAPVKVSTVVLSTQLQGVPAGYKTANPLVQGGVEIMPNLTHVVNRDQKMYFYYEVYEPSGAASPQVRTNLAFYRGKVKVFETPVVERTALDAPDRKAAVFRFVVPENSLKPGFYTCQVNIIDEAAGKFTFPRLEMYVK